MTRNGLCRYHYRTEKIMATKPSIHPDINKTKSSSPSGFHHIGIPVENIKEELEWWLQWSRFIGGEIIYYDETFASLACTNIHLNFVPKNGPHPFHLAIEHPEGRGGDEHRDRSRSKHHYSPSGVGLELLWLPPGVQR